MGIEDIVRIEILEFLRKTLGYYINSWLEIILSRAPLLIGIETLLMDCNFKLIVKFSSPILPTIGMNHHKVELLLIPFINVFLSWIKGNIDFTKKNIQYTNWDASRY